jgi:DNA-binding transcriptional regulator PaaX
MSSMSCQTRTLLKRIRKAGLITQAQADEWKVRYELPEKMVKELTSQIDMEIIRDLFAAKG